ncbi:MAG: PP2C family protein-serine/threonine phosphatase [Chloroflexota bacterium]
MIFNVLINRLNPIPKAYAHLTADFDETGRAFLRQWLLTSAWSGGLIASAYLILPFVLYQNQLRTIFFLYSLIVVCYCSVGLLFKFMPDKLDVSSLIFCGWSAISILSLIVMRVTNDYTSASGILVLTVVAYAGLIPWSSKWTVWLLSLISVVYGALFFTLSWNDYWIDYLIMGALLIGVVLIFGAAHALLIRVRWQSFLNEHLVQIANTKLQQMNSHLQDELQVAQEIQIGLLPPKRPIWPNLDVVCFTRPAREVGGDFYNYHHFQSNDSSQVSYALAVGDVSGKGLSAALMMATNLAHFNALLDKPLPPSQRLGALDLAMKPYAQTTQHNCALCYIEFTRTSDTQVTMQAVNAGCIPPYIKRQDGTVEPLELGGFPLGTGLAAQLDYQSVRMDLSVGDTVIMVSDGVVEAMNQDGGMFGFERLSDTLNSAPNSDADQMLRHISMTVDAFVGSIDPHDDLTIVVLQVK